jgi:hypothetical protein
MQHLTSSRSSRSDQTSHLLRQSHSPADATVCAGDDRSSVLETPPAFVALLAEVRGGLHVRFTARRLLLLLREGRLGALPGGDPDRDRSCHPPLVDRMSASTLAAASAHRSHLVQRGTSCAMVPEGGSSRRGRPVTSCLTCRDPFPKSLSTDLPAHRPATCPLLSAPRPRSHFSARLRVERGLGLGRGRR